MSPLLHTILGLRYSNTQLTVNFEIHAATVYIFQEILNFLAQMLLSIQHVHSKQILHRDLKTQNILLDKRKRVVKIGDFGISKVLSSKSKAYTVRLISTVEVDIT